VGRPRIRSAGTTRRHDDPARQHRTTTLEPLPGHLQAEFVESAERRQVGAGEVGNRVRHVEVFLSGA
jgi:hypothetical protein